MLGYLRVGAVWAQNNRDQSADRPLQQAAQARVIAIQPLLQRGQVDLARALAERYRDYDTLMTLCEQAGDSAALQRYIDVYGDEFADAAFQWYLKNGTAVPLKLLGLGRGVREGPRLHCFCSCCRC